jgi:Arc/MetJ-type ribon-helix-helix transcriptional regulator
MARAKIAITIDEGLLRQLDACVEAGEFPNRSQAIEGALRDHLDRMISTRLERECAKLDPAFEQAMTEEGLGGDQAEWPAF